MWILLMIVSCFIYFNYIGSYIYELFKNYLYWNKFKFPIGFITALGSLQLVSFPMQYLHVSSKIVSIIYSSVLIILFLSATVYFVWKRPFLNYQFTKKIFIEKCFFNLLVVVFIGIHLGLTFFTNSLNIPSSDQSFYITWVENNVDVESINMITPLTGTFNPLHIFYNFQSYSLFLAFISQIFSIPSIFCSVWFGPIFLLVFISTTILNACNYFKVYQKRWIIIFFILSIIFNFWYIENYVKYNTYPGPLRSYLFIIIIIVYYEFFHKQQLNYTFINLSWLAAIAVQSTTLFNGYLFVGALIIYDIFILKKYLIFNLFKSSLALHLYLFFFLRYAGLYKLSIIGLTLAIIGLLIDRLPKVRQKVLDLIYHDNTKKFIILGYGFFILLTLIITNYGYLEAPINSSYFVEYLTNYYFNHTYYTDILFSLLSTVLKVAFFVLNIYLMLKVKSLKNPLRFFIQFQIIFIIFFYNPLVAPFISTFITGSVYFRLRDILYFVPFTIVCFLYVKDHFKHSKFILISTLILGSLLGVINIYEYLTYEPNKISNIKTYEYMYRLPKDVVQAGCFLDEYIKNQLEDRTKILPTSKRSQIYALLGDNEPSKLTDYISLEMLEMRGLGMESRPVVYSMNRQINYLSHQYEMFYTINEERGVKNINLIDSLEQLDKYALEEIVLNAHWYEDAALKYTQLLLKFKIDFIVLENNVSSEIKEITTNYYNPIYYDETFSIYELKNR